MVANQQIDQTRPVPTTAIPIATSMAAQTGPTATAPGRHAVPAVGSRWLSAQWISPRMPSSNVL